MQRTPAWIALLVSGGACSKVVSKVAPEPPSARAALGEGECARSDALTEPLVVDLNDQERGQLELALGRGVAVLRVDCDGLALLPGCTIDDRADYNYVGFTKKERVLRLRTADELAINLPTLGAVWGAELSAGFESGTSLDIALVTVGQRATVVPRVDREELRGACEGATHFVKHAYVGAKLGG